MAAILPSAGCLVKHVAEQNLARGDGNDPISDVLVRISWFAFTFLLATLLQQKEDVTAALLVVSGYCALFVWPPLATAALIAWVLYFAQSTFCAGAIALFVIGAVGYAATTIGLADVARNLTRDEACISPFDGMPNIYYCAQHIFFGFAVYASGTFSAICWSGFGVLCAIQSAYYVHRLVPRWHRIHFPLMHRFCAGPGDDDHMRAVVTKAFPAWSEWRVKELIVAATNKMESFADRAALSEAWWGGSWTGSIETALNRIGAVLAGSGTSDRPRMQYVIAEIVGHQYGAEERLRYLDAVFRGRAP